jgi:DNA (cytosine-5)-methyltransferase 1
MSDQTVLCALQKHQNMNSQRKQIIDLFAGVGGLSLGAVRAGFHLALAVELDKHAMAAHELNFPGFAHWRGDISNLTGEQILSRAGLAKGDLHGLVGGPPCQGFSAIGQRNVADPRNHLFTKFFQLVAECEPRFFVAENVPGILDEQYDDVRRTAFGCVKGKYTILEPLNLIASDFGAATNRERVFFIGYRSDVAGTLSARDFESNRVDTITTVADSLFGLPRIRSDWLTEQQSWRRIKPLSNSPIWTKMSDDIPDGVGNAEAIRRYKEEKIISGCFGTRHTSEVSARYARLKPGKRDGISKAVRLKLNGFCPTLRAGTGSDKGSYQAVRPIHPTSPRVITPREAARLQGFPDWFQFSPTKWHSFRQIGNSVSPILAEHIFTIIRNALSTERQEETVWA